MKNFFKSQSQWKEFNGSFLAKILGKLISSRFSIEKISNEAFTDDDIVIHISFYDAPFNLQVASSLLKIKPQFISGYKRSFYSLIKMVIKKIVKKKGSEESFEISKGFRGFLSLTSEKFFKKNYTLLSNDPIQSLLELNDEIDCNIYLVPHMLFWNKDPEFLGGSQTLGNKSILSALLSPFRSSTKPALKVLEPVSLKSHNTAFLLRKELSETYEKEKRIILGPVLKAKHNIRSEILLDPKVIAEIISLSENNKKSEVKLRKQAYKYFNEIAADFSITYIKYFSKTLNRIYKKVYDDIIYSREELDSVLKEIQGSTPVFIPSHKSMMDFLLISSLFYNEGITPPHIVAGLNMNFFPMGKIFRRSGGFFMRRSFRDNPLYSLMFRQYIKFLVHNKYGLEFFIEGGRSRTGRLLKPMVGIMKYISEAMESNPDEKLKFIPISINYDRIFEEGSFISEIRGKEKKQESTTEFVKTRRLLKKKYGKVYITFNKPLDYHELMESEDRDLLKMSQIIADEVNSGMMISIKNLVSAGVLAEEAKGFYFDDFSQKMSFINRYIELENIPASDLLSHDYDFNNVLLTSLRNLQQDALLADNEPSESSDLFFIKSSDIRQNLYYYRNSIMHHFLPLSAVSSAILLSGKSGQFQYKELSENYDLIMSLLATEFYGKAISKDSLKETLSFMEKEGVVSHHGMDMKINEDALESLRFVSRLLNDIFDSYFIVLSVLYKYRGKKISESEMFKLIRKSGVELYHSDIVVCDESLSLFQYKNIIKSYESQNVITKKDEKNKFYIQGNEKISNDYEAVASLLSKMCRDKKEILMIQKNII